MDRDGRARGIVKPKGLALLATLAGPLLFFFSCQEFLETFPLSTASVNIAYDTSEDATYLFIRFWVGNRSQVDFRVASWSLVFKSGRKWLLEINGDNQQTYVPFLYCPPLAHGEWGLFQLQSNNPYDPEDKHPWPGKLFAAAPPDSMDVFLVIAGDDGKVEGIDGHFAANYAEIP